MIRIGAYHAAAWAGLVLSDAPGRGFGLRVAFERDGERVETEDLFYLVHEVGPHAPDGRYARVAFDTDLPLGRGPETPIRSRVGRDPGLLVEWARLEEAGAVMRLGCGFAGILELRGYFPWDWTGSWRVGDEAILGEAGAVALAAVVRAPRQRTIALDASGEAVARVEVLPGQAVEVGMALACDDREAERAAREAPGGGALDAHLESCARTYEDSRVTVHGHWEGLAAAVTNNIHWMVLLQPETHRRYTPAGRRWIFPAPQGGPEPWTVFCWDSFFGALELGVEAPELARETLEAALDTQYPNDNIPNWRGRFGGTPDRSQPPVGAYAVLTLFLRTGDRALLKRSFPALERWSAWWRAPKNGRPRRDGNTSGLFKWGCDEDLVSDTPPSWEREASAHQRAAWESGQDDLPCWEEAGWDAASETFDLESVDLNALLVLDDECLSLIAAELGETGKAKSYRARCQAHRRLVDERLWDEERGLYLDRRWDGARSNRVAASHFYPLLAGIPDARRAERMIEALQDPDRFWGEWILPTISRDDPAYPQQQYWRGTIWPPTNYLVGQGLRRYGFDEAGGELAARSVALFLETFRTYQLCRENFDSRTGEGGGQWHQSWGPLFALLGLEEFADVTPWEGLRIGSLAPRAESRIERLRLRGTSFSIRVGPQCLEARVDGTSLLEADGPLVLRQVQWIEESRGEDQFSSRARRALGYPAPEHSGDPLFSAETHSTRAVTLRIGLSGSRFRLELDGEAAEVVEPRLLLPPGRHRLDLRRLA